MSWLQNLFGASSATTSSADPAAPDYVPTPKRKVPGAMHPQVRANLSKPPALPRAVGCGIVYDRNGRPKITADWLENLSPAERRAADTNLAEHGWRVTPENTIEPLEKV